MYELFFRATVLLFQEEWKLSKKQRMWCDWNLQKWMWWHSPCSLGWVVASGLPYIANSATQLLALPWTRIETERSRLSRESHAEPRARPGGGGSCTSRRTRAVAFASTCRPWWAISLRVSCLQVTILILNTHIQKHLRQEISTQTIKWSTKKIIFSTEC